MTRDWAQSGCEAFVGTARGRPVIPVELHGTSVDRAPPDEVVGMTLSKKILKAAWLIQRITSCL